LKIIDVFVMKIETKRDVVVTRQQITVTAQEIGMSSMKETQLRTAASELLSNMIRYAGSGVATIEKIEAEGRNGVRARFEDQGPGIADIESALSKGYSTGKSLGHGLSGCRNLVDLFEFESEPGKGTRAVITKWK
jgi:serine/threonine-protein kinase RsbT